MGKFKLNKSNFSFGHGTGSSPNKIIPLINVVGQAAKTYIAGKQGLKNIGIIKEDEKKRKLKIMTKKLQNAKNQVEKLKTKQKKK